MLHGLDYLFLKFCRRKFCRLLFGNKKVNNSKLVSRRLQLERLRVRMVRKRFIMMQKVADLLTLHASSQLYFNSFLPSVIRDWNELPEVTRDLPSIATFKHELDSDNMKIPSYYFDGKRLGQIYHARLRTNSLNQHLFSNNIIDGPLCACGAVEDTTNFLFRCHRFNNLRQELFLTITSICQPTSNILLYGAEYLTYTENKQIFLAVREFLIKSKRFEIT